MIYAIHILKLIFGLVPWYLRQPLMIDWIDSLLHPLQHTNDKLVSLANAVRYKTAFNGQIIRIEHVLNDTFDFINRGIYIEDGNVMPIAYYFNSNESNPIQAYTWGASETNLSGQIFTFFMSELETDYYEFIVNVPITLGLATNDDMLNAIIKYYKLAGKRYIINLY